MDFDKMRDLILKHIKLTRELGRRCQDTFGKDSEDTAKAMEMCLAMATQWDLYLFKKEQNNG